MVLSKFHCLLCDEKGNFYCPNEMNMWAICEGDQNVYFRIHIESNSIGHEVPATPSKNSVACYTTNKVWSKWQRSFFIVISANIVLLAYNELFAFRTGTVSLWLE